MASLCCRCPDCERSFFDEETLQKHAKHHEARKQDTGDRPHQCQFCGKRFRVRYLLL